jgi:hypothetical protein
MFLFAGHNDLSVVTGAASCGDARPGAALDSGATDGRRGGGSRGGGGSHGGGGSRGIGHPRGARGSQGAGRVDIRGR